MSNRRPCTRMSGTLLRSTAGAPRFMSFSRSEQEGSTSMDRSDCSAGAAWVRIGTPMLRPHQSLELVEIIKKFARTWGCKLDLTDFAPPERTQSTGNPRVQHVVSVVVMQHPRRPACAHLPVRGVPTAPIARARRDVQNVRLDQGLKPRSSVPGHSRDAPRAP